MSHAGEPVPGHSPSAKLSVAGYVTLVIGGILLTLVILFLFHEIFPPIAALISQITDSIDWSILLVPLGGLAYFVYRRRFHSKLWWMASRVAVWFIFMAVVFWLYRVILPKIAPGAEFAILTILVAFTAPVIQTIYGNSETGDLVQTIAMLSSKIKVNLADAAHYNDRGFVYLQLDNKPKAMMDFDRAIELDPQHAVAYNNRGLTRYYQSQSDAALADLNRAIELKPDYAHAYNNRGLVYGSQGRFDEAISEYTRALEIDPTFIIAYHNRGMEYYKMGEFEKSLADLQTSKRLAGNYITDEARYLATQLEKGKRPRHG
jgi:tetratricopeptide (TPR) repeat protein